MNYRCVSTHPEDLADGRVVGPGDEVEFSAKDLQQDRNKLLIKEGLLLSAEPLDINDLSVETLRSMAASQELEVKGTGADGSVVKDDYVKALNKANKKEGSK